MLRKVSFSAKKPVIKDICHLNHSSPSNNDEISSYWMSPSLKSGFQPSPDKTFKEVSVACINRRFEPVRVL